MICDCQLGCFNCEQRVRCFLGDNPEQGRIALDELIEKVKPLICGVVNRKLRSTGWWQDRGDVVQGIIAILCNPDRMRPWLEKQDRGEGAPFCHWVAPVAVNGVNDWIRRQRPMPPLPPDFDPDDGPDPQGGLNEQAAKLREVIRAALLEFPLDWRLIFCMKWSYVEPTIAVIMRSTGLSERTVFYRLGKMYERISCRYTDPISPELAKIVLVGTRHPVAEYNGLPKPAQVKLNGAINQLLAACPPLKQQFAFFSRYSPLALEVGAIAHQVGEDEQAVRDWLCRLETQIRELTQTS